MPASDKPPALMAIASRSEKSAHEVERGLTWWPLFCIVVANMIGTGIFTTSGFMMGDLRSTSSLLMCWMIGGALALAGALTYGELGAMFPQDGGDYVFMRESYGKKWAFLSGWVSLWVGFSAPIAASAMAFGKYTNASAQNVLQMPVPPKILAIAAILLVSAMHLRGLLFGARMQSILSSIKIACILLLIGLGIAFGRGSWSHFDSTISAEAIFVPSFATSLIFASYAYSGWNAAAYLGGEVKNPGRNIPLSIITGTIFVIVLYMLLNITFVYALGAKSMAGVEEIGEAAASALFGKPIGAVFGFFIALFLLSTISAMVMAGPRVYYAMARDGVFFTRFNRVDRKHHVPAYAILLQAGIAIFMVATSTFYSLLIYIGFVLAVFASLTVAGTMILRYKHPGLERPYRTWGYPVTPLVFIGLNIWIVVFSLMNNPIASVWGLVTIGSGLAAYHFFSRRRVS